MIATYRPGRLLRFIRNPFFHEWSRAAQPAGYPDRIEIRIAGTADKVIRAVIDGRADVLGGPSRSRPSRRRDSRSSTGARFTPTRARTSRRSSSTPASHRSTGSTPVGRSTSPSTAPRRRTPGAGRATPSRRARCCRRTSRLSAVLPLHGRLDEARQVVGTRPDEGEGARRTLGHSRHEGHFWAWNRAKGFNRVAVKALQSLGYHVALRPVAATRYWGRSRTRGTGRRSGSGWAASATRPRRRSWSALQLRSVRSPCSPNNNNASEFCDPSIDRQMRRRRRRGERPAGARALWQRVDREVTDAALG